LEDFSISRSSQRAEGWGVEVPDDKTQIMYVWFDALANYLTGLDWQNNSELFKNFWPADMHVIGKGILRFHAIYWPAMLLSAGLKLPKKIFVHGYLTVNGQKISKSLGNVIDPFSMSEKYSLEVLRYYLLREISSTEDGDFSEERLKQRYESDLANGLGNLVARVLALSEKISPSVIARIPTECRKTKQSRGKSDGIATLTVFARNDKNELAIKIKEAKKKYQKSVEEIKFNEALESIWQLITSCDEFVEQKKPWALIKKDQKVFDSVMSDLLCSLQEISLMLEPFMPETAKKIKKQITENKKSETLFPRLN
jgi:methionyl-tRNA synthetase